MYNIKRIPQKTIDFLLKDKNISELTYKIYISLFNYQEIATPHKKEKKYFTLQDIKDMINIKYKDDSNINKKIMYSLCILKEYGLIDYNRTVFIDDSSAEVECFILNKVNPKISDFKTSEISFIELYEKGYVLDI